MNFHMENTLGRLQFPKKNLGLGWDGVGWQEKRRGERILLAPPSEFGPVPLLLSQKVGFDKHPQACSSTEGFIGLLGCSGCKSCVRTSGADTPGSAQHSCSSPYQGILHESLSNSRCSKRNFYLRVQIRMQGCYQD